jgi:hypothetical protein
MTVAAAFDNFKIALRLHQHQRKLCRPIMGPQAAAASSSQFQVLIEASKKHVFMILCCYAQAYQAACCADDVVLQVPEFYNFPPFFTLQPVLETRYICILVHIYVLYR